MEVFLIVCPGSPWALKNSQPNENFASNIYLIVNSIPASPIVLWQWQPLYFRLIPGHFSSNVPFLLDKLHFLGNPDYTSQNCYKHFWLWVYPNTDFFFLRLGCENCLRGKKKKNHLEGFLKVKHFCVKKPPFLKLKLSKKFWEHENEMEILGSDWKKILSETPPPNHILSILLLSHSFPYPFHCISLLQAEFCFSTNTKWW